MDSVNLMIVCFGRSDCQSHGKEINLPLLKHPESIFNTVFGNNLNINAKVI